jgi:DNA-binding MarR family transcriptional regulator
MKVVVKKAADAPFADSLYFTAGVLAREVEKLAIECWKPTGLSPSLGHIVYYLLHYANVTGPMVIARNLLLSPSTVTRLLEKLERKGLVIRFIYDKTRMVQLTQNAWQLEPTISECEFSFRKRCYALLGKENIAQICPLLSGTTDKLRAQENVRKPTEKAD